LDDGIGCAIFGPLKHLLRVGRRNFFSQLCRCVSFLAMAFPSFFFGLGVTNNAAKPDCTIPTGDNGSLYVGPSSDELIVI
jgi:hypothetical protein